MTKQELSKIFFIVKASYPRFYRDYSTLEVEQMLTAWELVLGDYSYEQVSSGVRLYLATDTKGFPPTQGQIIEAINKIEERKEGTLTADQAWECVVKAVSNSSYNSSEEFQKLPDICKEIVVGPRQLQAWVEDESFNSVARSNFLRAYQEKIARKKEEKKTPIAVKNLIESKKFGLIKDGE